MAEEKQTISAALKEKKNVMLAVILRDMRSRFFNHGIGFLMVPLWPLVHILILLTIYTVMGRASPFGDNLLIFFATGLLPTLTFMYVSRGMAMSVISNRNMMSFPIVKTLDIMTGRAFLEFIGASLTLLLLFAILSLHGEDPFPIDPFEAILAYLSVIVLAVGVGYLVAVACLLIQFFITIWSLTLIVIYLSSGVMFVPSRLPDNLVYYLSFNPVFQVVEWVRSAYFLGSASRHLDKQYVLACGLVCLCLGLLTERLLRRHILEK